MTKIKTILFILLISTLQIAANPPKTKVENNNITLNYIDVKDKAIKFVVSDIHSMILRKNKGFLWPATKIAFFKKGDDLYFDVTAIDNSWSNMFCSGEKPYGFFVIDGRMFIACIKDGSNIDLGDYFSYDDNIERTFHKSDPSLKPIGKNPIWHYQHKGTMATVLDSANMLSLGR